MEDDELVLAGQLDGVPRAADVIRQVDVTHEQAGVGEQAQLTADEARDQQVPVPSDGDAARLVTDRPLRRLAVTTQLHSAAHSLHFARVVDDAKCIVVTRVCVCVCLSVCLCVCPRPHAYTIARTQM